jgi:hypothetical protein
MEGFERSNRVLFSDKELNFWKTAYLGDRPYSGTHLPELKHTVKAIDAIMVAAEKRRAAETMKVFYCF